MKLYLSLLIVLLFFSCNSDNKNSSDADNLITTDIVNNPITAVGKYDIDELPKFEFTEKSHDFGIIIQGEKVSYTFKYKNIGGSDLVLRSVRGSCGCTVPKWSKEPLPPGKEANIEIVFNSAGKLGKQHKTVTMLSNTQPNKEVLYINCEVIKPN